MNKLLENPIVRKYDSLIMEQDSLNYSISKLEDSKLYIPESLESKADSIFMPKKKSIEKFVDLLKTNYRTNQKELDTLENISECKSFYDLKEKKSKKGKKFSFLASLFIVGTSLGGGGFINNKRDKKIIKHLKINNQ